MFCPIILLSNNILGAQKLSEKCAVLAAAVTAEKKLTEHAGIVDRVKKIVRWVVTVA